MAWEANISVQFLSTLLQENRQEAYEEIKVTLKIESPKNHALQSIPDALNQNDYLQSQDHGILKYIQSTADRVCVCGGGDG